MRFRTRTAEHPCQLDGESGTAARCGRRGANDEPEDEPDGPTARRGATTATLMETTGRHARFERRNNEAFGTCQGADDGEYVCRSNYAPTPRPVAAPKCSGNYAPTYQPTENPDRRLAGAPTPAPATPRE